MNADPQPRRFERDAGPIRPSGPPPWPRLDPAVADAINQALRDGTWGQYHGGHVERFEKALADYHGVPHVQTCATGTLAIEIALRSLGVGIGDDVIMGAYDYEPNFLTVHAIGARPVLIDLLAENACLDATKIEPAITPATKAILATHLHGGIVSMSRIREVADRHRIPILEDASQATGALVEKRPAGTWGDAGVLSFGGSKLLAAGRGGAILTRSPEIYQRASVALLRGNQRWAPLSELQAIALIPQLVHLPGATELRTTNVNHLLNLIREIPGLRPFQNPAVDCQAAYYKLGFYFDGAAFGLERHAFVRALRAEGIAFDAGFRALHVGRAPSRYASPAPLIRAESAGKSIVVLHHPVLSLGNTEIEEVAAALWKTYHNAASLH